MKKFPRNNPQDGGDDDEPEENRGDRKPSPPAQEVLVVHFSHRLQIGSAGD